MFGGKTKFKLGYAMIDATYLKAHRTASSLRVKRGASGG